MGVVVDGDNIRGVDGLPVAAILVLWPPLLLLGFETLEEVTALAMEGVGDLLPELFIAVTVFVLVVGLFLVDVGCKSFGVINDNTSPIAV